MLALFGVTAHAQSFPRPSDVSAEVGLTPVYDTTGTQNIPVNPLVTPPAQGGLTNIPLLSYTGRVVTGSVQPEDGSGGTWCLTIHYGGSNVGCTQNKFRTHIDFTIISPVDPIRNFCQPGASHLHTFFGSGTPNACSTYKSLRNHAISSAAMGTDANGTAYWIPTIISVNPFGNGKNYAIRGNSVTLYYENGDALPKTRIPVGMRYVFGFDMGSTAPGYGSGVTGGQYAWLQTTLDATNSNIGHTRYRLDDPLLTDSFGNTLRGSQVEWYCAGATPSVARYLVNPDGTDPYGGTCASGALFYARITAASCWNGKDLWSAGGYRHFIPQVRDTDRSEWVCPKNYYLAPTLAFEAEFTQHGWTDRQKWCLSSDIAYRAANGLTSAQVPCGYTFHGDWMDGWDHVVMNKWMDGCIGTNGANGHTCANSRISSTEALIGDVSNTSGSNPGAGGRNPQVNTTNLQHVLAGDNGWVEIPSSLLGTMNNMHMHTGSDPVQ